MFIIVTWMTSQSIIGFLLDKPPKSRKSTVTLKLSNEFSAVIYFCIVTICYFSKTCFQEYNVVLFQATSPVTPQNNVVSGGRSQTKREQRSGNTLYQELSFHDADSNLNEGDDSADITGYLTPFALPTLTNSVHLLTFNN